jgi:hypothetical protein
MPLFLKLKSLELDDSIVFANKHTLNALLEAPLQYLVANIGTGKGIGGIKEMCFRKRGRIPTLGTFVWTNADLKTDHSLDFLRSNTHLRRLSLPHPVCPDLLEHNLLPLLSREFKFLKSLDLTWATNTWEADFIPESGLQLVATIESLEQLQISGYNQDERRGGWWTGWTVNHAVLRQSLASLPRLKKLSITRDVYSNSINIPDIRRGEPQIYIRYYPTLPVRGTVSESEAVQSRHILFSYVHGCAMLKEARLYMKAFPKLEWLYLGQLQFEVCVINIEGIKKPWRYIAAPQMVRSSCKQKRGELFGSKNGW